MHLQHARTDRRGGWRRHHRDHERTGLHRFFHHGRGGRAVRRGNVRFAILAVLRDRPMHGYQVIQELEGRTQGRWRPSAGSVYPTLQLLEDQGLLSSTEVEGRRTYALTEAGRQAADESPLGSEGWLESDGPDDGSDLHKLVRSLMGAVAQLQRNGSPEAHASAREVLVDARRRLYLLLADDEADTAS
jgi:DNA-binding PadR family transcriptional regulator